MKLPALSSLAFALSGALALAGCGGDRQSGRPQASLAAAGVNGALQDPVLELHDGRGSLIYQNDNWRSTQEKAIIATTVAPANDNEAAILVTLPAGAYTAVLRGANDAAGVALVEIYALDP